MMLDRRVAPDFVKSTAFDLIHPERTLLPNNVEVFFIEGGSQDVLKLELIFEAGRWYEQKWGVAFFTSNLLNKGTQKKSSFDIAQKFDYYGAHIEISPGLDFVSVSIYSLNKHVAPVLNLLNEILASPSFPEKELAQSKAIFLQNLKVNHEKTSFLASKHFRKTLFGAEHPYGKELEEADVEAITPADLTSYYRSAFVTFKVFVSGKFDEQIRKEIVETFGSFPTKKLVEPVQAGSLIMPGHEHIEKESSVQSSIRMGRKSVMRSHPDYFQTIFVAHLLGGYFGSRLMKNIREEKGLTYGIHAAIHPLKRDSYLLIGADVNKENVDITFKEIRKEIIRLREEKISTDELDTARNHFIGSLQSEITTPFAHADKLKTIHLFSLKEDYYQNMIAAIGSIDAQTIMTIAGKHFHENSFLEIAVG